MGDNLSFKPWGLNVSNYAQHTVSNFTTRGAKRLSGLWTRTKKPARTRSTHAESCSFSPPKTMAEQYHKVPEKGSTPVLPFEFHHSSPLCLRAAACPELSRMGD
jgi:hypothetical protein